MNKTERQALLYKTDPNFRKRHIKNVVKSQRKRRKIISQLNLEEDNWRELVLVIDGIEKKFKCCRIGHLAKSIKRTDQTIRLWERSKWLPETIRYKGHRYYTKAQYKLIVEMFFKYEGNLDKFFLFTKKYWLY